MWGRSGGGLRVRVGEKRIAGWWRRNAVPDEGERCDEK